MNIEIKKNSKSNTYFLPLFNRFCNLEYIHLLKNTYLWKNRDSLGKDTFCILYHFDGSKQFAYFEGKLIEHSLFINYYDYGKFVLYEFNLNDELVEMRNTLIKGEYSKLEDSNKADILSFNLSRYGLLSKRLLEKIFNKDESLRLELAEKLGYRDLPVEYELTSPIEPENEIFENDLKIKR